MKRIIETLSRINGYSLFTTFFICGFFGWGFETATVYAKTGFVTRRGLVFVAGTLGQYLVAAQNTPIFAEIPIVWGLPIIIIYGLGGVLIAISLKKFTNPIAIFFLGAMLATVFELITSYYCEIILHREFWNYSSDFMNFQGRICLRASIAWGAISVFAVKVLIPKAYFVYSKEIRLRHHAIALNVLIAYTILCVIVKYVMYP